MSSIFHGGNTYIFYNTDTGNNQPTAITYKNIDELGAFPQVKINSSTTSLETYNDEWVQVLSSNMSIDSVSIVVHYLADNESHQYLDGAFTNQTNFQIKVSLYESQDSLDQHYVILNGYISGFSDSGDQNEVYSRTYTFTAEDVVSRGTAQDPASLRIGDFGVGADGETYPQYESATPAGNSFIKVPALREDNPIGGDLGGFAFVDNGGDKTAQLAIPSEGSLGIYVKNTDNDWLSIPLKSTNDGLYVPLTRTINGKVLTSNITLSKTDIGLTAVTNDAQLKIASNLSDLANVATARTNLNVYSKAEADATTSTLVPKTTTVNGQALSGNVSVTAGDVGLGNVLNAVQLVASNNLSDLANVATARTNLSVYSKAEAVPSTLTVNGKALSTNITLTSSDTGSFSIANNLSEGIPATIRINIGAAKSGTNSDITGLTALSGQLRLGADAVTAYDAVTLRQLQAATGTGTATINGVMNNFLGAVEWFLGTRAAMPGGHLSTDGQLLSRATYPDLWAAIQAGTLISTTEALWQASAANRGYFSTGDGSTTFRMPDLNGVQSGSIASLFLRGNAGTTSAISMHGNTGNIVQSAAPNITGGFWNVNWGNTVTNGYGAFTSGTLDQGQDLGTPPVGGDKTDVQIFDASRVNAAYGRNGTSEVRPSSVVGIWVMRVNGLFSAANTNFNVFNSDASAPANGTIVYGGDVRSSYRIAGTDTAVARLRSRYVVGGTKSATLSVDGGAGDLSVTADGEVISTNSPNTYRIANSTVSAFQRLDSTNWYFMLSDTPTGSYNSLRPLAINIATGDVTIGGQLKLGGNAITQSGQIAFSSTTNARQTLINTGVGGNVNYIRIPISTTQAYQMVSVTAVQTQNSSGDSTITFPVAFTTINSVQITNGDGAVGNLTMNVLNALRTTGFDVRVYNVGSPQAGAVRINYIATGLVNI